MSLDGGSQYSADSGSSGGEGGEGGVRSGSAAGEAGEEGVSPLPFCKRSGPAGRGGKSY